MTSSVLTAVNEDLSCPLLGAPFAEADVKPDVLFELYADDDDDDDDDEDEEEEEDEEEWEEDDPPVTK